MLTILKRFGGVLLCCLSFCGVLFADIGSDIVGNPNPPVISGCPSNCTATITWTTSHSGSSWVYLSLNRDQGIPGSRFGQQEDVTNHTVVISGLVPYNAQHDGSGYANHGIYTYYVATQRTSDGTWSTRYGPITNNYNSPVGVIQTTGLVTGSALTVQVLPYGQKHVYPGHDLYMVPAINLLTGGAGANAGETLTLVSYAVSKSGTTVTWNAGAVRMLGSLVATTDGVHGNFNPGTSWDGYFLSAAAPNTGDDFIYQPADASCVGGAFSLGCNDGAIRVRIPSSAAAGTDYNLHLLLRMYNGWDGATTQVGSDIVVDYPFTVYNTATWTDNVPTIYPTIPNLTDWQNLMTGNSSTSTGGEWWCTALTTGYGADSVEYGNFQGPSTALTGDLSFNSAPSIWKFANYDGSRVYMQIADYQYNTPTMPGYLNTGLRDHWKHCAQESLQQWDNYVVRSLGTQFSEPNQLNQIGAAMYYMRTHDATALAATQYGTDQYGGAGHNPGRYGFLDTQGTRIFAYTWDAQIAAELAGHAPWQLTDKATDLGLAILDEFQQATGTEWPTLWYYHPFVFGALMEAMISQYELDQEKLRTPDPAIPVEIGKAIYRWHTGRPPGALTTLYNSDIGTLRYNNADVPMSHTWNDGNSTDVWGGNMALFLPAEAWYWHKSNDSTVLGWADALFQSIWHDTGDVQQNYGPKEFNQVYKWTFDYINYRTNAAAKASFLPSQNTYEGQPWADTTPPTIFNEVNCNVGSQPSALCQSTSLVPPSVNGNQVTLKWDTSEPTTGYVYFKTGSAPTCTYTAGDYQNSVSRCLAYYGLPVSDSGGLRNHSITIINGLLHNTTYQYVLYSQDSSGNGAMTPPGSTFTTQ